MWNLLGLLVSFVLIILLVRLGRRFGLAMLLAAVVLTAFSLEHMPVSEAFSVFKEAVVNLDTIGLAVGVLFIGILANSMKETGEIEGIIGNLRNIMPREGILASIPAVFGLLPVPGGALMSAPMVEEEGKQVNVPKSTRAFLNLWFRHVEFLVFPLAPPLLLLAESAEVGLHWLILIQVPIFLLSVLVGIFLLWREVRKNAQFNENDVNLPDAEESSLLVDFSPIMVSVGLFFLFSYLTPLSFYLALVVSLPVGIAVSFFARKSKKGVYRIIREGISLDLPLAVLGIIIFYNVVYASGLADTLSDIFLGSFLPLPVLILLISFLLGFSMGHNLGAVGISYAILASAISGDLSMIALLYVSSFFGYLISPIHLCVAVTYEYFDPNLTEFYKLYLLPTFVVLFISTIFFAVLG
ncbi:hypothetical protein AKJ65_04945 [candidate division MSBL1 archaeon SCGC-AAA259E19]|uniref:DUF401 family protein n=2 Tax=candidate division MSBL1 TaxID=215777 RepID=A0A133V4X7_9EURY|nr:hypothetical protein AKJ65_04945 [candidate division MSBL1 archaeon SCGC-AAA259E19]KXB01467.1 hypothetical protein AKJ41_01370 [candidate division MSBL1 archaeon SCGC-AAA259O05]